MRDGGGEAVDREELGGFKKGKKDTRELYQTHS